MAETVTFSEPEGFVPPENLDADSTFQAMATFKVLPDNELQLIDIEGYEIGGEGGEDEEEQEPGAGEAAPAPGAPGPGGMPPGNQSEDRLAPGANQTNTMGFAERLGQMFRNQTAKGRRGRG